MKSEYVGREVVVDYTADATLTRAQSGQRCTNLGATGVVTLTLPQDAIRGDYFDMTVLAAYELRAQPGAAGAVYINGAKQADAKYISADDEAESVRLTSLGNGDWAASWAVGTWSVQG